MSLVHLRDTGGLEASFTTETPISTCQPGELLRVNRILEISYSAKGKYCPKVDVPV